MRPIAVLLLNSLGLLAIWGLLEAPHLAAWILIAVGLSLPGGLAHEARRGRLDGSIAFAAAWWSGPFILLLGCYLLGVPAFISLCIGIAGSGAAYLIRRMSASTTSPNSAILMADKRQGRTI